MCDVFIVHFWSLTVKTVLVALRMFKKSLQKNPRALNSQNFSCFSLPLSPETKAVKERTISILNAKRREQHELRGNRPAENGPKLCFIHLFIY